MALYAALPGEVGTDLLLDEAWRCKKDVFLPRCRPEKPGEMDLLACASRSELCVSSMGIAEPRFLPCSRFWEREGGWDDALVVVPGLAFDRMGYRLGYGGGYYDRFLEDARSVSVGLTLLGLIANQALPRGSWDRAVMHLCSEEGLICCKG